MVLIALVMTACGDSTPRTTPTSPTTPSVSTPTPTPPTPTNDGQTLQIASATLSPQVCVPGLTTLQGHIVATGPQPLTYRWSFGPGPSVAATADAAFSCAGIDNSNGKAIPVIVTVSDSQGHTDTRQFGFAAGDLNGSYYGQIGATVDHPYAGTYFSVLLHRNGNTVTGIISDAQHHQGTVDPAQPGYLGADGSFRIRFKLESDFTFVGQLAYDPSFTFEGIYYATGHVEGGQFDGQPFLLRESVD
jgi:hypothetical protein